VDGHAIHMTNVQDLDKPQVGELSFYKEAKINVI
jgi:hypothetical protein